MVIAEGHILQWLLGHIIGSICSTELFSAVNKY